MVRAELGSGNRDNAIALLKRAEERLITTFHRSLLEF